MNREKSYYREMREKHIDRKKRIVKKEKKKMVKIG